MVKTQKLILEYMNKNSEFNSESEQLDAFLILVSKIFSNILQATPDLEQKVKNGLFNAKNSLNFKLGFGLFTLCFELGKIHLAPLHIPPPTPFILKPLSGSTSTYQSVSSYIATELSIWFSTGLTPAGAPTPVSLILS